VAPVGTRFPDYSQAKKLASALESGMSDVAGIDPRVAPFFQSSTFDVRGSGGRHHAALQFLN
jgi:hypothetical protein